MGRRILNLGIAATHARITKVHALEDTVSISDYDAFLFDPHSLKQIVVSSTILSRKQSEIRDLVHRKGGLLICILRPPFQVQTTNGGLTNALNIFDLTDANIMGVVKNSLRLGTATKWGLYPGAKGVSQEYLKDLKVRVRPEAHLEVEAQHIMGVGGSVLAVNSAGWPICFEFMIGTGRLCFVPISADVPDGQRGAILARMVEEHFGGSAEIELPDWVEGVSVPGADANNLRIGELEKKKNEIAEELSTLSEERSRLLNFRVLLFGYGKSMLEPVVRQSFRELGFKVLEPEDYEGVWDVDLTDEESGASAVGEVEGSEGAVNVDKLRQLLEYVEAEENAGRKRKGILIGNGYRLKSQDQIERKNQFTEMAVKRANGFEYCLLPTTELFVAVCTVLKSPNDEKLKKILRDSILSRVGVWKFAEVNP